MSIENNSSWSCKVSLNQLNQANQASIQSNWNSKSLFGLGKESWRIQQSGADNSSINIQRITLSAFEGFKNILNKVSPFKFDVKVKIYNEEEITLKKGRV